jgi:hypothetical protein
MKAEQDGLFPEMVPDGPWPRELLVSASVASGLRYILWYRQDEPAAITFLGHPALSDIRVAVEEIARGDAGAAWLEQPPEDPILWTYGQYVVPPGMPEEARLTWDARAQTAPDRFPITVWEVSS